MASKQAVLLALLAACLLLRPSASADTAVEYCNKHKNYPVKVSGVEIMPDPVTPGQPATFKITASTDKTIKKGKLDIDVKYWIIPVHSESHDICEETSCPATGKFVLAHSQILPSFTPPGSYTITMTMKGDNGTQPKTTFQRNDRKRLKSRASSTSSSSSSPPPPPTPPHHQSHTHPKAKGKAKQERQIEISGRAPRKSSSSSPVPPPS